MSREAAYWRRLALILTGVLLMTGVVLLPNVLASARIAYEVAWGADLTDADGSGWAWSDITTDVRHAGPASAALGGNAEQPVAPPGQMSLVLDNATGKYTPYNPLGANWPNVRGGLPIRRRVSLDGGATWYTRWQGYVTSWARSSTLRGVNATVAVTAAGVRQRLAQLPALRSAMYRSVAGSAPFAHWPLEDGSDATAGASAVPAVGPLVANGTVNFGTSAAPGSAAYPTFDSAAGRLVSPALAATSSTWRIEAAVKAPASGNATVLRWFQYGGTIGSYELLITPTSGYLQVRQRDFNTQTLIFSAPLNDGGWHHVRIDGSQFGADISVVISFDGDVYWPGFSSFTAATIGPVNGFEVHPAGPITADAFTGSWGLGSLALWNGLPAVNPNTPSALRGYAGETPYNRAVRLCGEEGVDIAAPDYNPASGRTMGPQPAATLLALLDECAVTDAAALHDSLGPGLRWQNIRQRYDQNTALTLAATELAAPPAPVADDARLRNRAVASRPAGGSAVHEDTTGPLGTAAVGRYETAVTANLADDSMLDDRARWEVHAGTRPGERFPTLTVDVHAVPGLAAKLLATTNGWTGQVITGWRLDLTGLSGVAAEHTTGDLGLVIEGWAETIDPRSTWQLMFNVSPQAVYDVWKVADSTKGRVGTAGHTLASAASVGATSLSLVTPAGVALWTTAAGDFPLYLDIAGIKVTVTAISGTSSPQSATVSGVTKALAAGAAVNMWTPGVIRL